MIEKIKAKAFYVGSEDSIVFTDKNTAQIVPVTTSEISQSIKIDENTILDCVEMSAKQFGEKYQVKEDAPLTIDELYYKMREWIVDEMVPLPKKKKRGKATKSNTPELSMPDSLEGLSRKDQVKYMLNQGESSPTIIAKRIGSNPSYVQRLIKQIENG